ncbi:recQ-mediated genome instability protein 1 isoform X2 [Anguilla anguilla]|uniref:recQ-mediated genome instability protein 1 isoform X2 n=1 Tax=Anguilla anguilla TaxID=7936 RepID=UPI0015AB6DAC|nr:recQ-mediated genome instability protein 1 isoform X2 [Anguilla anguilla]
MGESGLAQRAKDWLRSTWHVQVPSVWVEACVAWVLQGAGGAPVSQAQVNRQALEQWLLTDLRDLAHPSLPPLGRAPKAELSGSFCVQMDSALDVSRPAYSQLQQRRGADCANERVSAATQATQRPWEATPTRVLMLQLTDGVQDLEALEYRPVPALSADLPPGTKLLLQGALECRLGVLLLTPANVRVLGGEVEELRDILSQTRVLARVLGLPEEDQQAVQARGAEPGPRDVGVSDEELLASLEAVADSGYGSRNERPHPSPAPQRSVAPADFDEDFDDLPLDELDSVIFQEEYSPAREAEPELVEVQPRTSGVGHVPEESRTRGVGHRPVEVEPRTSGVGHGPEESRKRRVGPEPVEVEPRTSGVGHGLEESRKRRVGPEPVEVVPRTSGVGHVPEESRTRGVGHGPAEVEPRTRGVGHGPVEVEPRTRGVGHGSMEKEPRAGEGRSGVVPGLGSVCVGGGDRDPGADRVCAVKPKSRAGAGPVGQGGAGEASSPQGALEGGAGALAAATDSITPPFTYLCVLARGRARRARVKAFIITLQGSLRSSSGAWQVGATVSDGTGYLDVRLSDGVLAGLIGFSVAESRALRKDPERQHQVQRGLQRCQGALVDMCCLMTLQYDPAAGTGTVLSADPVTADTCRELENRVRGRNQR